MSRRCDSRLSRRWCGSNFRASLGANFAQGRPRQDLAHDRRQCHAQRGHQRWDGLCRQCGFDCCRIGNCLRNSRCRAWRQCGLRLRSCCCNHYWCGCGLLGRRHFGSRQIGPAAGCRDKRRQCDQRIRAGCARAAAYSGPGGRRRSRFGQRAGQWPGHRFRNRFLRRRGCCWADRAAGRRVTVAGRAAVVRACGRRGRD